MSFSERLRYYREKANYSQKEIAEKIGISFSTYNNYETRGYEPKIETLLKLAAALGTDVNTLLGFEKEKPAGVNGSDYKELIQIITEARESILDGAEVAADNSDISEALAAALKLLECGLNMARDIYVAYLENENKKLFESVLAGAAGRSVPDPAGGGTVPA